LLGIAGTVGTATKADAKGKIGDAEIARVSQSCAGSTGILLGEVR